MDFPAAPPVFKNMDEESKQANLTDHVLRARREARQQQEQENKELRASLQSQFESLGMDKKSAEIAARGRD